MIRVHKPDEAPRILRDRGVTLTAALCRQADAGEPLSFDRDLYGAPEVKQALRAAQHDKCCFCESKLGHAQFGDVEHYRPKVRADRRPGCAASHGYWWLAFTWSNLLFACPSCNRSSKNDRFPLCGGSVALEAEDPSPGREEPLLLDPGSAVNPVEHIQFKWKAIGPVGAPKYWWARPRRGSVFGQMTIDVCDLNHYELRELRGDYFQSVIKDYVEALAQALANRKRSLALREFERAKSLLRPENQYVALAYDALCYCVPNAKIHELCGVRWPRPSRVGVRSLKRGRR